MNFDEGRLCFFREKPPKEPKDVLAALLELVGAERSSIVTKYVGRRSEWQYMKAGDIPPTDNIESEFDVLNTKVLNHFKSGTKMQLHFPSAPLGERIFNTLKNSLPESIYGDHLPGSVIVGFGPHDIVGNDEDHKLYRLARPFLSLEIWGYNSPPDIDRFKHAVFEVPEIRQLKMDLDRITGGCRQEYYFL